jgi:hypothetical protein
MERQDFVGRQRKIEICALGHNADQPLYRNLLLPNIVVADPGLAAGWSHAGCKNTHGRRFAGSVRPKETENLAGNNFQGQAIERGNLRFGLLGTLGASTRAEARGRSHGRRRVVDLAEVDGANTYGHKLFSVSQTQDLARKYKRQARLKGYASRG